MTRNGRPQQRVVRERKDKLVTDLVEFDRVRSALLMLVQRRRYMALKAQMRLLRLVPRGNTTVLRSFTRRGSDHPPSRRVQRRGRRQHTSPASAGHRAGPLPHGSSHGCDASASVRPGVPLAPASVGRLAPVCLGFAPQTLETRRPVSAISTSAADASGGGQLVQLHVHFLRSRSHASLQFGGLCEGACDVVHAVSASGVDSFRRISRGTQHPGIALASPEFAHAAFPVRRASLCAVVRLRT